MPKGKTVSPYDLSERRERAFGYFTKGWTNKDVAKKLKVGADTVARYRSEYEARIGEIAAANPGMLTNVIENSIRALEETDLVKKHAWDEYEKAGKDRIYECPECEAEIKVPAAASNVRNMWLNTVLKAQEQRHKIFGLFGVKAEFFSMVDKVRRVQDRLIEFMQRELCAEDRAKLEKFLTGEMQEDMAATRDLPALPAEVVDMVHAGDAD